MRLTWTRGHFSQTVRRNPVFNLHAHRQYALNRYSDFAHGFFDHPVVRRRHRPNVASLTAKSLDERHHLGKKMRHYVRFREASSELADFLFRNPVMYLHHLAAHIALAYVSGHVFVITTQDPRSRIPTNWSF